MLRIWLSAALVLAPALGAAPRAEKPRIGSEHAILISTVRPLPTVTQHGRVYATGLAGDSAFAAPVFDGAGEAFGLYQGWLVYAKEHRLRAVNLYSKEDRLLLDAGAPLAAAFSPRGGRLAVLYADEHGVTRMALGDLDHDIPGHLRSTPVRKEVLHWSDDGEMLYYLRPAPDDAVELVRQPMQGAATTVPFSLAEAALVRLAPDEVLQAEAVHLRESLQGAWDGRLAIDETPQGQLEVRWNGSGPLAPAALLRDEQGLFQPEIEASLAPGRLITAAPSNDEPAGAWDRTIASGISYSVAEATKGASDPAPSCLGVANFGHTVWFRLKAPWTGVVVVDSTNSDYDTVISAYDGTPAVAQEVGCNDDFNGRQARVTFNAQFQHTYLIMVAGYGTAAGYLFLTVNAGSEVPPVPTEFTQDGARGVAQPLQINFLDHNQTGTVTAAQVLVSGSSPSTAWACYVQVDPVARQMYLRDNTDSHWLGPVAVGGSATVENTQCRLMSSGSAVTASPGFLRVTVPVFFKTAAFNGAKTVHARARDANPFPPFTTVGSFTIAYGPSFRSSYVAASGGFFQITARVHEDGVYPLKWVQFLIIAPNVQPPYCLIHYDAVARQWYLYGDEGYFRGPVSSLQSSNWLKSSNCIVQTSNSRARSSLDWPSIPPNDTEILATGVCFSPLVGARNLYVRAYDANNVDTGWQFSQAMNVAAIDSNVPLSFPQDGGAGTGSGFKALYREPYPFHKEPLGWTQMLFNAGPGSWPFCLVHYDRAGNGLWLYGDSGFFLGPVTPGAQARLENQSCLVDARSSWFAPSNLQSAYTYDFDWYPSVAFKTAFAGAKSVYLRQLDAIGRETGWLASGSWTIPVGQPAALGVSPAYSYGNATVTATAGFYSPFGASSLSSAVVLVAKAPDGGGSPFCFVHYDRPGNKLWFYRSDNGVWVGPVTPGATSTAMNSNACSLDPSASSATVHGPFLELQLKFTFKGAVMTGDYKVYLQTMDILGQDTGRQERGKYNSFQ